MASSACIACDYDPGIRVTGIYTIIIKAPAQSLNGVGVNSRNNRTYRASRRRWERLLAGYRKIPEAKQKRRVYFTRFWGRGKRAFDYGNLVGGFKPLLDTIVKNKWLLDDSPKQCSEYYRQNRSPDGVDHIVVVLEDYEQTN